MFKPLIFEKVFNSTAHIWKLCLCMRQNFFISLYATLKEGTAMTSAIPHLAVDEITCCYS